MPMGIVSDKDFDRELEISNPTTEKSNVIVPEILPMERPGRSEGDNNVPDSLRKIIGETAVTESRQDALALAAEFGISPSSVSAYTNGSTSTSSMDRRPNRAHIEKAKQRISKIARGKLMKSLNAITDDKLETAKVEVLSQVARNMAAIVKEMEPEKEKDGDAGKNAPQFIVYSPTIHNENRYEVIMARE